VRQYSWLFADVKNKDVEHVVILSGDHLYRMDYMDFVQKHADTGVQSPPASPLAASLS